jgi:UDP-N-acetylglucosamine--N-acetylmuramyl-(pentapeptide) pyrophosphoryl-undecaprenol N-acetylglucosamine transferase
MLVASTGGHLIELALLAPRIWPPDNDEIWVTFDSEQSRSLLVGRRVSYIRDTPPRDWLSMLVNTRVAWDLLKDRVDTVISNGAGIAVSFLPLAAAKGISTHYIECSARVDGRSLAGRILERARGIKVYTQNPALADSRWLYSGSSFDGYQSADVARPPALRKIFITVGTLHFPFLRLLRRLQAILPATIDVVVQAGTDYKLLDWPRAEVTSRMSHEEIRWNVANADVVVAHAGIGSALGVLDAGKVPVLVPRSHRLGEHVDDHQEEIARHLSDRGLAVVAGSESITVDHLVQALDRKVERTGAQRRFILR